MKKFILSSCVFCLACMPVWATINIGGVERQVDTLEYRKIGPGIMYARMNFPEYPLNVYTMTIDLKNQHNTIETFQANEHAGSTEAMTGAYTRLSSPGHQSIGSVNGNFWILSAIQQYDERLNGQPHSGCIRNGEMVTDPNGWNRGRGSADELLQEIGFAAIDKDKKIWVDDMGFDGKVTYKGSSYSISEVNRVRNENELIFYNSYSGKTMTDIDGTDVFIKPVDGQSWNVNENVECVVTRIEKGVGGHALEAGESALSGNGQTFLNAIAVGEKLTVNMGVYTLTDKIRPEITQLVTGNALVMRNGVLTPRNNNEEYNSQVYSRTGIGMSQDGNTVYLIVIDKVGGSKGTNTETMCQILQHSGAWNIASMDAGGSAQMMIRGALVNAPADGKERPVANGWMVFSTAPADNELKTLEFDSYKLEVPTYSSFIPRILGYNQYGVLVEETLQDFTLSCDPALGMISENGRRFSASGNATSGYLTVTSPNGATGKKLVSIVAATGRMKNDSVLADKEHPYSIEVVSKAGANEFLYDPSALSWQIDDPKICKIENGMLSGLSNGTTNVTGTLGEFTGRMKVNVEIPTDAVIPADDMTGWTIKAVSSITDGRITAVGAGQGTVDFTYKSGRAPYIEMDKDLVFYSLPDTVRLVINSTIPLLKIQIAVNANGKKPTYIDAGTTGVPVGEDYLVSIPVSSIVDVNNRGDYPAQLTFIKYMIDTKATNDKAYKIAIKEFSLVYNDYLSGIDKITRSESLLVSPNPVKDGIVRIMSDKDLFSARFELYDQSGKLALNGQVGADNYISVSQMESGLFFLKIFDEQIIYVTKLIINSK